MCQLNKRFLFSIILLLLQSCTTPPKGVVPIMGFEIERYLGKWHEIARLDHSFERGLTKVTAEYTSRDDGGINVINRGYDARAGEWKETVGRAYFVEGSEVGQLKVSFFGPFYGGYTIVELDEANYQYALVSGPTRGFLWILARTPDLPQAVIDRLVERAMQLGFPVEELIFL